MKIVKALLILVLTLFWAVISLIELHSSSSPLIPLAVVSLAYVSLIYIVWPIGTTYSEVSYNRFLIVLGLWFFIFSIEVLINNECPSMPVNAFTKSGQLEALIMFICRYLGKYPTALFIFGLGCYAVYLGYTKKPNPSLKRDWLKPAP